MEIYILKEKFKLKVAFEVFFSDFQQKEGEWGNGLYGNYNGFFKRNMIAMKVWLHSRIGYPSRLVPNN